MFLNETPNFAARTASPKLRIKNMNPVKNIFYPNLLSGQIDCNFVNPVEKIFARDPKKIEHLYVFFNIKVSSITLPWRSKMNFRLVGQK